MPRVLFHLAANHESAHGIQFLNWLRTLLPSFIFLNVECVWGFSAILRANGGTRKHDNFCSLGRVTKKPSHMVGNKTLNVPV